MWATWRRSGRWGRGREWLFGGRGAGGRSSAPVPLSAMRRGGTKAPGSAENVLHAQRHIGESKRSEGFAAPGGAERGKAPADRIAVQRDSVLGEIHEPYFGDARRRVQWHLDVAIVLERGVRDLDQEQDIVGPRVGRAIGVGARNQQSHVRLRL